MAPAVYQLDDSIASTDAVTFGGSIPGVWVPGTGKLAAELGLDDAGLDALILEQELPIVKAKPARARRAEGGE